ncbi:uncharacterized protein MYCFIDRAFT_87241 [Pseudocercospora fijiensis CIRAD86]|uniref:Uncharacterized protein n=1 Tax=Pseudocercospora fijiensis (strain CIRAD86) TaxID=383855 RepID=M2ZFK6_PSEFD|nr:uncharacterized protein MYCFIDRAFT_87241 [Pseudocercospora fijiensis CIRAD86]EME77924.1 hypothetical protein MYCFIDRAFT_87241 [Pseudocercospora fijiensis CIRAD86]
MAIHFRRVRKELLPLRQVGTPPFLGARSAGTSQGMAAQHATESSEDEFHSLSAQGEGADDEDDESESVVMAPPKHPVPSFQGAFEESIVESMQNAQDSSSDAHPDADMRRRRLLDAERFEGAGTRWKHKPGAKYHPFVKLMAQVVFGLHLLMEGQAKSNEEVVRILQSHVNEVDSFLESTSDDFDLAIKDIEERVRYLRLPMQHMDVFEVMLDEKKFRTELLAGNEKIEKIIEKTAKAMNAAVFDIENGLRSTQELSYYLTQIEGRWPTGDSDISEVFAAMRGNEQGWDKYLKDLKTKSKNLRHSLATLESTISEISKHAAAASRRNKPQSNTVSPTMRQPSKSSVASSPLRSKFAAKNSTVYRKPGPWLDKPLPKEPSTGAAASQTANSKPHPVPFETRYEQPRQRIPTPGSRSNVNGRGSPLRPQTATRPPDERTHQRRSMRDLADFLRHSDGLRSHPPDGSQSGRFPAKKPHRSQSHDGARMMTSATEKKRFRRSRSFGANPTNQESERRTIPRKPVGSSTVTTTVSSDAKNTKTQFAGLGRKESATLGSSFSRRLSRRLKNAPPITNHAPRSSVSRPVDSAHASEKQRQSEDVASDHDKDLTPDLEQDLSSNPVRNSKDQPRPGSRNHSLFPKDVGPLTPSQASLRENSPSPHRADKTWVSSNDISPTSISTKPTTHGSKASRTLSLRNFFSHHRKEGIRNVMVS